MLSVIAGSTSQLRAAPKVTSFRQLDSLHAAQLAEGRKFEAEATVLCYDANWHQLYLFADGETFFFSPEGLRSSFKPGDRLKLTGITLATGVTRPLTNLEVVVLGHSSLPATKHIALSELELTAGAWVELAAPVRMAETSRGRLALTIGTASSSIVAYVMGDRPTNDCKAYVGARVRLSGINTSRIVNGRMTEPGLMVPGIAQVTIEGAAAVSIAILPVVSVDSLLNRPLDSWTNTPVHLNGLVSSAVPGESLLLRDPTGTIQARPLQLTMVQPGERINLWGYLDASAAQPVLRDAYFEIAAPDSAVLAAPLPELSGKNSAPTVTNILALRGLNREQLAPGVPVKFRGCLIYVDPDWHTAFVHDGGSSVYVELNETNLAVGQQVRLTGRAVLGTFGPAVRSAHVRFLGVTNLPAALPADLDDVADGHLDAQWVEMRGVVRRATSEWGHLYLTLMSRQGKFNVLVPGFDATNPPAGLLDSRVAVTGVCGSELNPRSQLSGVTLYAAGLEQIRTLEAPPADPFAVPSTFVGAVATFDPEKAAGRRVKIRGCVTLSGAGQSLFVQDSSGGIRVEAPLQAAGFRPGDRVEVLGFPALGEFSPHLEEPIIRRLGAGAVPAPQITTAEQLLLQGTNDGAFVRLEAQLLQSIPRSAQPKLILQQGALIFTAQLAAGRFNEAVGAWRPGSLLRLTGVCALQGSDGRNAQSLRLLLPGPEAAVLVKAAPVLTSQHLQLFAGLLALLGVITLGWISSLRRQVKARTTELSASQARLQQDFEHIRTLSELGKRLNSASSAKDAARIIVEVADRLIGWDACICDLYSAQTDQTSHVLNIDLIDGRRVECQPKFTQLPPSALARATLESGPQLILRQPAGGERSTDGIPFGDTARRSASLLYVPISNERHVIGVLSIQSYSFQAYTERDLITLQALADHCSGALDRIQAHEQLVELSRQAGMAEVATGVLHNVGNVLNSVNVSVALLSAKGAHAARLARVSELLLAHRGHLAEFLVHDPKGQKLPDYLEQLARVVAADETQTRTELEALSKNIEHIKEIVAMQQSYARLGGVTEKIPAGELVEDALRLNSGTLARHEVQVCRDFPAHLPVLTTDRHKVLQILINLIRNAKYACDESGRLDKKLTVSIGNGDGRLRICVADNGVGIPRENLTRIFGLGFSTRKDGHGFGLHSAAVAAEELGGSLAAHSDGPGTGAQFTLELPLTGSN